MRTATRKTAAMPIADRRATRPADASRRRGLELAHAGFWGEAARAFADATRAGGHDPLNWLNLAQARLKLGLTAEAAEAATRAAALDGGSSCALLILVEAQFAQRRLAEAVATVARLDAGGHADHILLTRQAEALTDLGRHREAVSVAMRALGRQPGFAEAHVALAMALDRLGLSAEASEALRTALLLRPGNSARQGAMIHMAQKAVRWQDLDADIAQLRETIAQGGGAEVSPFAWINLSDSAAEQLQVNRRFVQSQFGAIEAMPALAPAARRDGERIRVAYLSSDFHVHATSLLLADVLERHDRQRLHVTLYCHSPADDSALRRRIVAAADAFVEVGELPDDAVAERIRADGIDILVDLKGHTRGARTGILARRPAPIQVSWLGYPGSMGAPFIDYLIGDPVVTPAALAACYDEKLALLPDCYQPNDRQREVGPTPTRAQCGLPDDAFVFASFNSNYKITPALFDVWCALLRERPHSVLWLVEWSASSRDNLLREAAARGIEPARLVFAPLVSSADNLGRLRLADLALDTYPVNGHTTTSDALWAGVPVVTRRGEAFASRVAASLLAAAGLPQLVADDFAEYARIALMLSADRVGCAALHDRLESMRSALPLFDSARQAASLGALYGAMFDRWQAGLPAAHLSA